MSPAEKLLGWLRRKLSALLRRMVAHLPAPVRWAVRLIAGEHGFGFWWLVATVAVAVALGLVVALLLTPVAGLLALLIVAIWALVRRHRHKRDEAEKQTAPPPDAVIA